MFWTVLKADLLFGLCSIAVSILLTLGVAAWRKRRMKRLNLQGDATLKPLGGPRAVLIGGAYPKPAHCPLCGQGWPLPGPVVPEGPAKSEENK
jgi:hypothetical protein